MTVDEAPQKVGVRGFLSLLRAASGLAWGCSAGWLVAQVLLAVAGGAAPVATAWLLKVVLDRLTRPDTPMISFLAPAVALACTGVAAAVMPQISRYVDAEAERGVTLRARERLHMAVGRLAGLARFENPRFHNRLTMAVTGASAPADVVSGGLAVGRGLVTVVGFLGALAMLSPWMLAAVVVAALPTLLAEFVLGRRRIEAMFGLGLAFRREMFYISLLTSVTAAQEVRLYGLGKLFGDRMVAELRLINSEKRRLDRRELSAQALLGLLGALVAGGGLIWAVTAAREGVLSLGDIAVFVAAVAGVQGGMSSVVASTGQVHRALLVFHHYHLVERAGPDLPPPVRGITRPVSTLRHGITLRDVWFRYDESLPWVLRGINLTIPAGRSTALVGLNGAGKSTLVKLLCRLYDPVHGELLWDGVDLRELSVWELRERIGVVFQQFMCYDLSAAENVGLGDVRALRDRGRIEAAAGRAGCDAMLRQLPKGFDTLLTRIYLDQADKQDPTTGVVLSGGQWQRVALARGMMRSSGDLLILDEPSSGLDAEAEHEVHRRLREHRAGRTSVLISHRLSTIRDADRIVVIRDGIVAESGTHSELLAVGGAYARLFDLQAAGYREPDVLGGGREPGSGATAGQPPRNRAG